MRLPTSQPPLKNSGLESLGYSPADPFGITTDAPGLHKAQVSSSKEASPQPLWHYITAGIVGSGFSDSVMHSLDTIKTRQQAAPDALKYQNTIKGYATIWREEGFSRGLYSGYGAAMLGSIPRGVTFFGTYEYLKKKLINEWGVNETVTHLFAGVMGDLVTSITFVPSEVLKTRLQTQGRYNNPYFQSGYNYKGLGDAISSLSKEAGGWRNFYSGYKATLSRDLPFSAMQFALYEKFRKLAFLFERQYGIGNGKELGLVSELLVGGAAGGITGILTTPLDVCKTRIQTQNPDDVKKSRTILKSSSVIKGISTIYKNEGFATLFSGVQPRFVWLFVQSSIMLLAYQEVLKVINDGTKQKGLQS